MTREFIIQLLISIIITVIISTGVGLLLLPIMEFSSSAAGTFILSWVVIFFYRDRNIAKLERAAIMYAAKLDYVDDKNMLQIECPCGKSVIEGYFFVNDVDNCNDYTCVNCRNTYKVAVTAYPILQTNPTDNDNTVLFDSLVDMLDAAKSAESVTH